MSDDGLAPDKRVPICVGFDLGSIDEVVFQIDIFFFGEKLKNGGENRLQHVFHSLGTEAINGMEIWTLSSGKPHEHDILAPGFGDLARGIDALCVRIDDDFHKHLRVIAVPAVRRGKLW
ncbi:hypothetical protein FHS18_005813 [Paenibacillus phyllosphaerae]|uniref:Uncharacterized protein n=1 Tax=Paenibacillus phyllosphaerae TaxID=274593 RepID=A0A7W5B3E2_9BACL|nr:hypothetical protein [Paenibacillus phyllosphaerae]